MYKIEDDWFANQVCGCKDVAASGHKWDCKEIKRGLLGYHWEIEGQCKMK